MIPLLKPQVPSWAEVIPFLAESRDTYKYTNFGPCFNHLHAKLSSITNTYALPVADGTAAIKLALQRMFLPGETVLIPDFTHVGTLCAVVEAGLKPVIASCDKDTFTLSTQEIISMKKRIDGFIVVSPFGYKVDFEKYDALAERLNLGVVYDLAGAWGLNVKTKNPFTYSLHATKNFSCGEGGVVCFNDARDYEKAQRLSNFDTLSNRHVASPYGGNHKASEITCAIALANLAAPSRISAKIEKKTKLISQYQAALSDYIEPHDRHLDAAPSMCVIRGLDAQELEKFGKREGVEFKQYYIPLSTMSGLSAVPRTVKTENVLDNFVAFPSDVSEKERDEVISTVKRFLLKRV